MAAVENKGTNPVVAVLANFCCFGILGYLLVGQTTKGFYIFLVTLVLSLIGIGIIVAIMGLVDVYMVAEAVQRGEEVDEREYKFELLYKLMSLIQKDAIYKSA